MFCSTFRFKWRLIVHFSFLNSNLKKFKVLYELTPELNNNLCGDKSRKGENQRTLVGSSPKLFLRFGQVADPNHIERFPVRSLLCVLHDWFRSLKNQNNRRKTTIVYRKKHAYLVYKY